MCKRNRPKFQVGDILERYSVDNGISYYLIMNRQYRKLIKFPRYYHRRQASFKKTKWRWQYMVRSITKDKIMLVSRHQLDTEWIVKKVG